MQTCLQSPGGRGCSAASEPIALGLALEIRARHIIQQKLIIEIEQRSQALLEVRSPGRACAEQAVERAVQPVIVDALAPARRKDRPALCSDYRILGDERSRSPARISARITRIAHDRRPRRHSRPSTGRILAETIQSKGAPQSPASHTSPKRRRALQADMVKPHRKGLAPSRRSLEQLVLLFSPRDPQGRAPARDRHCSSSSPSCATVSCATRRPRRTEHARRQ